MFNYIPLKPKSKAPILNNWKEYQTTPVTEEQLEMWRQQYPSCNWGIVTGSISGIVVLDIDGQEGLDAIPDKSILSYNTPIVKTGKGWHIYFKHPGTPIPNAIGIIPHVDIRGDGGYVVAPPSIHSSGAQYQWISEGEPMEIPPWLWKLLTQKRSGAEMPSTNNWVTTALLGVSEGERNATAAKLTGYFLSKRIPLDTIIVTMRQWNSNNRPPMSDKELLTVINSIASKHEGNYLNSKGKPITENIIDALNREYQFCVADGRLLIYDGKNYTFDVDEVIGQWLYDNVGAEVNTDTFHAKIIRNLVDSCKRRTTMAKLLATEPRYAHFANGILDTETMEFKDHTPDHIFLHNMPVEYDPEATCPNWLHFIETTLEPGYAAILQEFMGYLFTNDTRFQKALLLYGTGANGKSIVINTIMHMLGQDYTSASSLNRLQSNRFALAGLVGKLANLCSESVAFNGTEMDIFKAIVSGDILTIEEKNKPAFDAALPVKLIFASNVMLKSGDQTKGNYRRWIIIPFRKVFEGDAADRYLQERIDAELPGVVNWALEGRKRLYAQNHFTDTPEDMISDMIYESDSVVAHVTDCCALDNPDAKVSAKVLYEHYKSYCAECCLKPVSIKTYFQRLQERYPQVEKIKSYGTMVYHGIEILESL